MAIQTLNPATGELVKDFRPLSQDEVEERLALATRVAPIWRDVPMAQRLSVVRRAGELLDERKDAYARLMTLEMGKPIAAAVQEAAKCATACRFYADHAAAFLDDETIEVKGERSYISFEPLGAVLAVMPWNFPFWQVIRFAAPALAAGNVGLLKHASNVPQCALALEQLFEDAGAPGGVFQTLLIDSAAVAAIVADDRIAAVTLTGSEGAGGSVAAIAGKHIKKAVLELGGSDPFIVMPSADLEAAAAAAVSSRTINNGQSCISAKRFIVAESIADAFTAEVVRRMRALTVGDPSDNRTNIGPLATSHIRDDLHDQVKRAVAEGARVLLGGAPRQGAGFYYEPTVLVDMAPNSPVLREETFGPVAAIVRAKDAEEAIRIANDSRFGLGAAAWTLDEAEIQRFAKGLEAGSVFINGIVASDPRFPFGGVKKSGFGRELSEFGIREFVNIKTVRIGGVGSGNTE